MKTLICVYEHDEDQERTLYEFRKQVERGVPIIIGKFKDGQDMIVFEKEPGR